MRKGVSYFLLILLSAIVIFPFLYMLSLSFFQQSDFYSQKAKFFPSKPEFSNYKAAVTVKNYAYYLFNSVGTSLLSASSKMVVIILSAFAFNYMTFKGKRIILFLLLLTLFIPQDAILYQNYRTISSMGLLNSWLGITFPSFFSASSMMFLLGAFTSLGNEYYESAAIDGANDLIYITRILIPMTQSVVITLFLQAFISMFNSYLWPLLVTDIPKARTLQIAFTLLGFREEGKYGAEAATIAISVIPFVIILGFSRRLIVKALTKSISS